MCYSVCTRISGAFLPEAFQPSFLFDDIDHHAMQITLVLVNSLSSYKNSIKVNM